MDLVVQRGNQQELYIPYLQTFNFFQVSSYQVYYKTQLDPRTEIANFIMLRSLTSPRLSQLHLQDATIQKEITKPKEVSLDPPLKDETPNIELPNNENILFDADDDVGTPTFPDLSVPSADEEEEVKFKFNNAWVHAIDILFKLAQLRPDQNNRNMSKSKSWTLQSSLLTLWMEKTQVNNQTEIADNGNLLKTL